MSDTPRTDAGARHVSVDRAGCITLWHSKNGGYVERVLSEQLERENAALREDKERLDWLEQQSVSEPDYTCPDLRRHVLLFFGKFQSTPLESLRAAIDAARAEEGQS